MGIHLFETSNRSNINPSKSCWRTVSVQYAIINTWKTVLVNWYHLWSYKKYFINLDVTIEKHLMYFAYLNHQQKLVLAKLFIYARKWKYGNGVCEAIFVFQYITTLRILRCTEQHSIFQTWIYIRNLGKNLKLHSQTRSN